MCTGCLFGRVRLLFAQTPHLARTCPSQPFTLVCVVFECLRTLAATGLAGAAAITLGRADAAGLAATGAAGLAATGLAATGLAAAGLAAAGLLPPRPPKEKEKAGLEAAGLAAAGAALAGAAA
jgi:hypothetical protein